MSFDVVAVALAALLVVLGWRSGLMRQVARVAAVAAVIFGTTLVAPYMRAWLFADSEAVSPALEVASMLLGALAIYVGVWFVATLVIRTVRAVSDILSTMDHLGGAALGALKALLLIYFGAVCIATLKGPLKRVDPDDKLHLRDGQATAMVEEYDLLAPWRFPDVERIQVAVATTADSLSDPSLKKKLTALPRVAKLLTHKKFVALLKDDALVEAARAGRYYEVLADERVRKLLQDDTFMEQVREVDWAGLAGEG